MANIIDNPFDLEEEVKPGEKRLNPESTVPILLPLWLMDDLLDVASAFSVPAKKLLLASATLGLPQIKEVLRRDQELKK